MPYADPVKAKEYLRQYDAKRKGTPKRKVQQNASNRRWKDKQDPEELKRKWREEKRAVYERDKPKILARSKAHRDRLGDVHRHRKQLRRRENLEHNRALERAAYQRNKETKRKRGRAFYQANKERIRISGKKYRVAHHVEIVARTILRDMTKRKLTEGCPKAIRAFYRHVWTADVVYCHWCKRFIPRSGRQRHVDHVIPITRGGKHRLDNLVASCSRCNLSKNNKLPEEFMPILAEFLKSA